jgi:hypothetical protein
MNQPNTEKEQLLMIFSEMSDQLAELESVLRKSYSDLHEDLLCEEEEKLIISEKRISLLEKRYMNREDGIKDEITTYSLGKTSSVRLKYELGF